MSVLIAPEERFLERAKVPGPISAKKLPQVPALTGLRFFAAFFILFAHAADWIAQFRDSNISESFSFLAVYGMPLFFVLSGFVIQYNYGRLFVTAGAIRATVEFAAARFARLFPLYLVMLTVAFFADGFIARTYNRPDLFFKILGYCLTLTQSWWYTVYDRQLIINWLFPVSWSISTEMFFYAAFVAVVLLILLLRTVRAAFVAAISFALASMICLAVSRYYLTELLGLAKKHVPDYLDTAASPANSFYRWLFYFSPYVRVLEFLLGCLTAHVVMCLQSRRRGPYEQQLANWTLVASLLALLLVGMLDLGIGGPSLVKSYVQHFANNFVCAPAIAFILFYVGRYDTGFTRFLSLPALVALGDTSYSVYLIHTWTLRIFIPAAAPELNWLYAIDAIGRVLCGILFTILAAYATYHLIEVPSRTWLRRRLGWAIASGFQAVRPDSNGEVPGAAAARTKVKFSLSVSALLIVVAVAGQAARSDVTWEKLHRLWYGDRSEIDVVSASYGLSCKEFKVPAPYINSVAAGNATAAVARACNSRQLCKFRIAVSRLGDPANGCGKDFTLQYKCTRSDIMKSQYVGGEANGNVVALRCTTE